MEKSLLAAIGQSLTKFADIHVQID